MTPIVQFLSYYAIVVATFYYFYFNRGGPVSPGELEVFCEWFKMHEFSGPLDDFQADPCKVFQLNPDNGNEFYMLNFIKEPTEDDVKAAQSMDIDQECKESAAALSKCYTKAFFPYMLKRFSFPVLVLNAPSWETPFGITKSLIDKDITKDWDFDKIAVVRYRSKRDFLEILRDVIINDHANIHKLKTLSVNQTVVYVTEAFVPISTLIAFAACLFIITIIYTILFCICLNIC